MSMWYTNAINQTWNIAHNKPTARSHICLCKGRSQKSLVKSDGSLIWKRNYSFVCNFMLQHVQYDVVLCLCRQSRLTVFTASLRRGLGTTLLPVVHKHRVTETQTAYLKSVNSILCASEKSSLKVLCKRCRAKWERKSDRWRKKGNQKE